MRLQCLYQTFEHTYVCTSLVFYGHKCYCYCLGGQSIGSLRFHYYRHSLLCGICFLDMRHQELKNCNSDKLICFILHVYVTKPSSRPLKIMKLHTYIHVRIETFRLIFMMDTTQMLLAIVCSSLLALSLSYQSQ